MVVLKITTSNVVPNGIGHHKSEGRYYLNIETESVASFIRDYGHLTIDELIHKFGGNNCG